MLSNNSVSGSAVPTWLTASIDTDDMTCHVNDLDGWVETDANGDSTGLPLGTSGTFVITIGWEQSECEKIQCDSINVGTKTIHFVKRGYDGTQAKAHAAGTIRNPNVFPVFAAADLVDIDDVITEIDSAIQDLTDEVGGFQAAIETAQATAETAQAIAETAQATAETAQGAAETAQTTAETAQGAAEAAQFTADHRVESVSGDGTTIIVSGTEFQPTISVGTVPYSSISGTPTTLPPSGAAGGDLTGTYPNPTLGAVGTAGTFGSSSKVPVITTDSKGRITSVTESTVSGGSPTGAAGGDLTGTYPNPTLAAVGTSGTKGSASSVPVFVTDSKGRVTSSTDTSIQITESQVTNLTTDLAAKLPLAGGTMTGSIDLNGHALNNVTVLDMDGLTGATAATRFVGATADGAPTSGTFSAGDFIIDQTAMIWICVTAGSPGTWAPSSNFNLTSRSSTATADIAEMTYCTGGGGFTITLPAGAPDGSHYGIINASNSAVSIKGGTNSLKIAGTNYGGGISYSVAANGTYLFVHQNGSWYCYSTNDIGDMVNYSDVAISKFGAATADVAMGSFKITGLANGTANSDAAAFGQIPTSLPPSGTAGGDLTGTYPNPSVVQGSTTVAGKLQLTNSTSSTSTTTAATPSAVKSAYDLANAALPKSGGTMTGAIAMGSQRVTGLSTAPGALTDAATVGMAGDAFPLTGLFSYIAWTNDPNLVLNNSVQTIGTVYYSALYIPYTTNISNIGVYVATAGAGLTNSYVGLYTATTQIGVSAAITTAWQSTGLKTHALTATSAGSLTNVAPGIYWVAWLVGNGSTTSPAFFRSAGTTANFTNVGLSATLSTLTIRAATGGTSQTALPGSIGLNAVVSQSFWAAIS
jgi:hypothetical protein